MKISRILLLLLFLFSSGFLPFQYDKPAVLIFSKTDGYRHASIPDGVEMFRVIEKELNISVDHTENAAKFTESNLSDYDTIVFLNTTGDILDESQQKAFKQFIQHGGGFVGIHAATDTEYDWPWYGKMIGAYFDSHPKIQEATIRVLNKKHPSTQHLPKQWVRTDEWYNFKNIQPHINILAQLDESTYRGGTNGENHPIAWFHEFEEGRIFYSAGGHTRNSYDEPLFRQHVVGGLLYVLGRNL